MYTGTMIEDLIESVQRAEKHAQYELAEDHRLAKVEVPLTYFRDLSYSEEMVGVA